ncbi:cytochrome c3 family protein [Thermosulfuriphilus sp.]
MIDINADNVIQLSEIETLFSKIKGAGLSPFLEERALVLRPYHNFTDEVKHIKDCTLCHTSRAPFYDKIFLKIPISNGWISLLLDKAVLAKMPPIPTKDYYWSTVHGKNGIECIEYHKDLKVLKTSEGFKVKTLKPPVCENCHEDIMREYKKSLHYRVSKRICFGCHDPHSSVPFSQLSAAERRKICTKCHQNVERKHDWLPQRSIHFKYLECAMCHSPNATKGIVFYFRAIDKTDKEWRLTYDDIIYFLVDKQDVKDFSGQDIISFIDKNDDGFLEDRELLFFIKLLNSFKPKCWQEAGKR